MLIIAMVTSGEEDKQIRAQAGNQKTLIRKVITQVEWLDTMSTNENHLAASKCVLAQNVLQVCSSST